MSEKEVHVCEDEVHVNEHAIHVNECEIKIEVEYENDLEGYEFDDADEPFL